MAPMKVGAGTLTAFFNVLIFSQLSQHLQPSFEHAYSYRG